MSHGAREDSKDARVKEGGEGGRAVNPLRNMEKGLGRWRDSGG